MLKRLTLVLIAIFSLFFIIQSDVSAQESSFTVNPSLDKINDFLTTVSVTFQGEEINSIDNKDLFICMEQDLCIDNKDIRQGIFEGNLEEIGKATRGLTDDDVDAKTLQRYKFDPSPNDTPKTIIVCGDGNSKLKTPKRFTNGNGSKSCAGDENGDNNDKDYFHAGSVYLLSLYQKTNDVFILHSVAAFYVNRGAPTVEVTSSNNFESNGKFNITVSSPQIRNAGDGDKERKNNYQVILNGPGEKNDRFILGEYLSGNNEDCVGFSAPSEQQSVTLFTDNDITLPGDYTIRIREQLNEDQFDDKCQGGFTYVEVQCKVGNKEPSLNGCSEPIIDPEGKDLTSMAKLFTELGFSAGGTRLPCTTLKSGTIEDPLASISGRTTSVSNPANCLEIETALGKIGLNLDEFILSIFTYVLSIAGIAALGLIIYGGYNYMVSRGDPEKIKHAREIITAAIIGLLFIIFSFVILQVIIGDILRIPNFNDPDVKTAPEYVPDNDTDLRPADPVLIP